MPTGVHYEPFKRGLIEAEEIFWTWVMSSSEYHAMAGSPARTGEEKGKATRDDTSLFLCALTF